MSAKTITLVGSFLNISNSACSLFTFKISLNSEVYLLVPHIVWNTVVCSMTATVTLTLSPVLTMSACTLLVYSSFILVYFSHFADNRINKSAGNELLYLDVYVQIILYSSAAQSQGSVIKSQTVHGRIQTKLGTVYIASSIETGLQSRLTFFS